MKTKTQLTFLLILSSVLTGHLLAYDLPISSSETVYDKAGLIKPERLTELQSVIQRVEKQTGVEMAVVTLPSLKNQHANLNQAEPFASDLFNQWGIGHKLTNNGVLVLVAEKDGLVRFEFGSDFVPEDLSVVSLKYERGVLPLLESRNYSEGVFAAAMLASAAAVEDVSWWWYHRVAMILFGFSIVALLGLIWAAKQNLKEGVWVGFVVFGVLVILAVLKFSPDNSKPGFGGGATTGMGLTERWTIHQ